LEQQVPDSIKQNADQDRTLTEVSNADEKEREKLIIVIEKARLIETEDALKKKVKMEGGVGEKRPRGSEVGAAEGPANKRVKITNDKLNKVAFRSELKTPIKFETLKIVEKGFVKPRNLLIITPQFQKLGQCITLLSQTHDLYSLSTTPSIYH